MIEIGSFHEGLQEANRNEIALRNSVEIGRNECDAWLPVDSPNSNSPACLIRERVKDYVSKPLFIFFFVVVSASITEIISLPRHIPLSLPLVGASFDQTAFPVKEFYNRQHI
jgi:hypothetical protein